MALRKLTYPIAAADLNLPEDYNPGIPFGNTKTLIEISCIAKLPIKSAWRKLYTRKHRYDQQMTTAFISA
jgi:hypothetical protein